jgi:type VI secretion system secreted protein Hcp
VSASSLPAMKRMLSSVRWVFPLLMLLAVTDAQAALDMFLEAGDNLKGDTQDKEFAPKHGIDVLAWSWGESNSGSTQADGGAGAGKVSIQDLSLTKYIDTATTALMLNLAKGFRIPEMKLTVRRKGDGPGGQRHYLEMTMADVIVTSLSTGGSGGEDRLTENISLNFTNVNFKYFAPDVNGTTTFAAEDLLGTKLDRPVQVPVPKLLANDRSSTGGTLRITAVASPTKAGGTVVLSGGFVTYTPPTSFVGLDEWTYTVTDGTSTAEGTVKVEVTSATAQTDNMISIVMHPGANFIQFAGIPGVTYHIERADQVTGPWQDLSGPIQADATGLIVFTHVNPPASQFYRTRFGP